MAVSRMSRTTDGHRSTLLSLFIVAVLTLTPDSVLAGNVITSESIEDAELITAPRTANEYVRFSDPTGEAGTNASPYDLKKHTCEYRVLICTSIMVSYLFVLQS